MNMTRILAMALFSLVGAGCAAMKAETEDGGPYKIFTIAVMQPELQDSEKYEEYYESLEPTRIEIRINEKTGFFGGLFGDSWSPECAEVKALYCIHANTLNGLMVPADYRQRKEWQFRRTTYSLEGCKPNFCVIRQFHEENQLMAKYYWSESGGLHGEVTFVKNKPYSYLLRLN